MFHIRLPIVLWQTFVINCKANTNVCLAFLRKAETWGSAFSLPPPSPAVGVPKQPPSAWTAALARGCPTSDAAGMWCDGAFPAASPGTVGPKRISQKGWQGKLLKHSPQKPVGMHGSSHASLYHSGPQSILMGETQARNPAFNSSLSCNSQFGSLGMAVLEQAWLKLSFNTLRLCGTAFILSTFFNHRI